MGEQGPLSGKTVGDRYVLSEFLGQGGFGVVYKAHHLYLHRQQAVKIFPKSHFSESDLREAQTVAALNHPNIIHLDDFWIEPSGVYLVRPFIQGGTLQDVLQNQQGSLEVEQIVFYVKQICDALGHAHAKKVAHLNLKPSNILVDDQRRLLLTDFGLAQSMRTPHYMAPEQLPGNPDPRRNPDPRSDIFSLGVILYQMITGQLPFDGTIEETIHQIQTEPPPMPLRWLGGLKPQKVERVIETALAKQPGARHPTVNDFWQHFRAAIAGDVLKEVLPQQEVLRWPVLLSPLSQELEKLIDRDDYWKSWLNQPKYKECPKCWPKKQCYPDQKFCDRCNFWFSEGAQNP